jgi:hypothetical protein
MAVAVVQAGAGARPRLAVTAPSLQGRRAGVYRRRRLGAGVLVVVAVLALVAAWPQRSDARPVGEPAPPAPLAVVVGPGDTVWELALGATPAGEDPRAYVAEVVAVNGIDPGALRPGTVLRLPQR